MKSKSPYPKECPAFRVKRSPFMEHGIDVGSIVQAMDFSNGSDLIACYAPRHRDPAALSTGKFGEAWGWWYAPDELKPLTPSAEEFLKLAIARGTK